MAIIKSTDVRFQGRTRGVIKKTPFVSLYKSGNSFVLRINCSITDKHALLDKCELTYDTEKRELIISSSVNGNVGISSDGTVETRYNIITSFGYWNEVFGIHAGSGRYHASVDMKDNIHVYFNEKIK